MLYLGVGGGLINFGALAFVRDVPSQFLIVLVNWYSISGHIRIHWRDSVMSRNISLDLLLYFVTRL